MIRVGQNRIYTPYMTVYLVISLPKMPYINRIYIYMVLVNPIYGANASVARNNCGMMHSLDYTCMYNI